MWRSFVLLIGGSIPPLLFSVSVWAQEPAAGITDPPQVATEEVLNPWWGRSFDKKSQFTLLSGALTAAVASLADHTVRDQGSQHRAMDYNTARIGDFMGTGIPGASIAIGQYFLDRENGLSHGKTLIAGALWTGALKFVTNRRRPGDTRQYNAFPSGHTSTTFATATSLYYSYGWKVGLPAYLIATGTGVSRIADDVHWFSDVVAGAFVGIWLGRAYHHSVENESSETSNSKSETSTLWFPSFQNDGAFIHVLSQF